LEWRLGGSSRPYRYFTMDGFECAIREGRLGRHPILVVGEYFLHGKKCPVPLATSRLRRVTTSAYDMVAYAGVQLHGPKASGLGRVGYALGGLLIHRVLPVCAAPNPARDLGPIAWFDSFQLSDCDIG
jgi:hypothetical protein